MSRDANDVLREHGADALRDALDKAPRTKLANGHDGDAANHASPSGPQAVTEAQRDSAKAELAAMPVAYKKNKVKPRVQALKSCAMRMAPHVWRGCIERSVVVAELCQMALEAGDIERLPVIEAYIREGLDNDKAQRQPLQDLPPPTLPAESMLGVPVPAWIDVDDHGKLKDSCANTRVAIERLGIQCRYDVFHDQMLVGGRVIEQWQGEVSDAACLMLRLLIRERFSFDPGNAHANDATRQLCLLNQFDPVCDYLDSLKWDGEPRLDKWLTKYLGAVSTPFVDKVGELMLVAAVRRARQPGCKFDQIPVFEAPEGLGKSTAIKLLAVDEKNFSDQTILGLGDKEQQEAMRGVWLFEIAELAGMKKADVERVKAFASRTHDRARPAYGRNRVDLPRRGILIGTTNPQTYLKSQTGNRRFWPVTTGQIDLDGLRRDRDQLWAEAAAREASGMSLVLPHELWGDAALEQDKRLDHDPWDDILWEARGAKDGDIEKISSTELLRNRLGIPPERINDVATKRLGQCMRRLGWTKAENVIRINGKQVRGFTRNWDAVELANHLANAPPRDDPSHDEYVRLALARWPNLTKDEVAWAKQRAGVANAASETAG